MERRIISMAGRMIPIRNWASARTAAVGPDAGSESRSYPIFGHDPTRRGFRIRPVHAYVFENGWDWSVGMVMAATRDLDSDAEYARCMRALNSQFAAWVSRQMESASCSSWEEGISDYLAHAKKIGEKRRASTVAEVLETDEKKRVRKEEVQEGEEENIHFTSKCKVFFREGDEWETRGVGHMSVRTSDAVARLVFRTDAGKVLLNARLYQGLKATVQDKSVLLVLYVADVKEDGEAMEPQPKKTLIRLGKSELAQQLKEAIEEHTPQ